MTRQPQSLTSELERVGESQTERGGYSQTERGGYSQTEAVSQPVSQPVSQSVIPSGYPRSEFWSQQPRHPLQPLWQNKQERSWLGLRGGYIKGRIRKGVSSSDSFFFYFKLQQRVR